MAFDCDAPINSPPQESKQNLRSITMNRAF